MTQFLRQKLKDAIEDALLYDLAWVEIEKLDKEEMYPDSWFDEEKKEIVDSKTKLKNYKHREITIKIGVQFPDEEVENP